MTGIDDRRDEVAEHLRHVIEDVKPKLRGWLHLGVVPLTLAAGVVLVVLAPTTQAKVGAAVFSLSALLLFTVSAVYHRGTWPPRTRALLQRFDHANIFVLIAGSYTPFTLLLLDGSARVTLLTVVWVGAVFGVASKVLWAQAPRWLDAPVYVALGWVSVIYLPDLSSGATEAYGTGIGVAVFALIVAGGVLYTVGAVVYGLKRPNPSPQWFGFHEVFHVLTVLAFAAHYVGVSLATYALR